MIAREARAGSRRLWVHGVGIALGVAALVAINSFRSDLRDSLRAQARTILGADLELRRNRPFPDSVLAVLDSAAAAGTPVSYATGFASMALAPATGRVQLVQVRAITGEAPYYGGIVTVPEGRWLTFRDGPNVLVDPALSVHLGIAVGDSIRLGDLTFAVAGLVTNFPGRVSLQSAIGPRVFIPAAHLEATNLLRRGSRAFYEAQLAIPDESTLRRFLMRNARLFEREQVRHDTVDETEDDLADAFDAMARFLGLVGLAALLLGGLGVASAVHVFVRSRLDAVAVLRCLGARQPAVFGIYLALALLLGVAGAVPGGVLGVAVQTALPGLLGDFLPLDVASSASRPRGCSPSSLCSPFGTCRRCAPSGARSTMVAAAAIPCGSSSPAPSRRACWPPVSTWPPSPNWGSASPQQSPRPRSCSRPPPRS
jgi:putative ABC transport system permease protein